jgi:methylated-DNA-[protein]-cysteine S-methyltransferase
MRSKLKMSEHGIRTIETPIGNLSIHATNVGICKVSSEPNIENNKIGLEHLNEAEKWFNGYFKKKIFHFPKFDFLNLSNFGLIVTNTLLENVKFGNTSTYSELSLTANRPGASRAVGTIMKNNSLPIIIPCHRIINKNNYIGNYNFNKGRTTKNWLLMHEGMIIQDSHVI